MKRLFLSVFGTGLLLAGSLAHAAQLDGLEIEPSGDKVQIILDTDSTQSVRVDKQEGSQTTLFLPKAKLPKAFQGTGLPPIKNAQAGVTAEVQETPDGLCIYLNSAKQSRNFYEIGFKRNQPPAPTVEATKAPLPKPANMGENRVAPAIKYHIKGNLPLAKAPAAKPVQVSAIPSPKPVLKTGPRMTPPAKATPVAKAVQASTVIAKPAAPVEKATVKKPESPKTPGAIVVREAETIPGEPEIVTETPETDEATIAQAVQEEEAAAYALLQQEAATEESAAETERELSKQAESKQPGALSWLGDYWTQVQGAMLSPVSRWIFASILLLGVFLFIASFVAVWFKKRIVDRATVAYELPPEVLSPSPETAEKDFFEPQPETRDSAPETFSTYLSEPAPEAWSPPPQATGIEATVTAATPTPAASVAQDVWTGETGSLLFSPPKSYGEAIKSSLQSHASPNVSAPFKPVKPEISTEGGPKTKRNKGFNQYLKR